MTPLFRGAATSLSLEMEVRSLDPTAVGGVLQDETGIFVDCGPHIIMLECIGEFDKLTADAPFECSDTLDEGTSRTCRQKAPLFLFFLALLRRGCDEMATLFHTDCQMYSGVAFFMTGAVFLYSSLMYMSLHKDHRAGMQALKRKKKAEESKDEGEGIDYTAANARQCGAQRVLFRPGLVRRRHGWYWRSV